MKKIEMKHILMLFSCDFYPSFHGNFENHSSEMFKEKRFQQFYSELLEMIICGNFDQQSNQANHNCLQNKILPVLTINSI